MKEFTEEDQTRRIGIVTSMAAGDDISQADTQYLLEALGDAEEEVATLRSEIQQIHEAMCSECVYNFDDWISKVLGKKPAFAQCEDPECKHSIRVKP